MSKKDTVTKDYIRDSEVFADVFNCFLYDGEQVIDPKELHEMDTTAIALPYGENGISTSVQKYRDVLKYLTAMTDGNTAYLIMGVEIQSNTHYAMPVRANLYDTMEYARQVEVIAKKHREEMNAQKKKREDSSSDEITNDKIQHPTSDEYLSGFWKTDRLIPVITLVVLFSAQEWDGPLSLHEMFQIKNEKILSFIPDYHINLISPASMSEEEIEKFHSNLREVMLYIKYSKDKAKLANLVNTDEKFKNLDHKTTEVISTITNTRYKSEEEKEEECNMCQAIDDMCADARAEGIAESIKNLMKALDFSAEKAMQILEIPEEEYEKYNALLAGLEVKKPKSFLARYVVNPDCSTAR